MRRRLDRPRGQLLLSVSGIAAESGRAQRYRAMVSEWHLYILRTCRGALYTGIATDVARRLREHASTGSRGAKCLRSQAPLHLVYQIALGERSLALRAERRVKRLPKHRKEHIVAKRPPARQLLTMLGLIPQEAAR